MYRTRFAIIIRKFETSEPPFSEFKGFLNLFLLLILLKRLILGRLEINLKKAVNLLFLYCFSGRSVDVLLHVLKEGNSIVYLLFAYFILAHLGHNL